MPSSPYAAASVSPITCRHAAVRARDKKLVMIYGKIGLRRVSLFGLPHSQTICPRGTTPHSIASPSRRGILCRTARKILKSR